MKPYGFLAAAIVITLAAAADERVLTGRVLDSTTGDPIAHARVTLRFYQSGQYPEMILMSDTDGSIRATNLPPSGFQIAGEKAGYLATNTGMGPIQPGDEKNATPIVLRLIAQAALEGTVVDDNDRPVENTYIQLLRQQVSNGRRQFVAANGTGTDETGYFRLWGLQAGRYYISVTGRLNGARRSQPLAYPPLFYPNAVDIASAVPVDLKAGDDRPIKIKLPEPIPAFEIHGVVLTTASNVNIQLSRQSSVQAYLQSNAETHWDSKTRSFSISHVTPGIYLLTAMVQDGRDYLQAGTMVTVGSTDLSGIRLEPVDAALNGTVRLEGAATAQAGFISVQSPEIGNGSQLDPDGKFRIPNLRPGTYQITPQLRDQQSCVQSILQGGRDVRGGMTVAVGVPPEPVEVVVTSHCGSIDATITPPDSGMPPNVVAMLLRKSGEDYILERQGFVSTRTSDGKAHAQFQGVAAGDYLLFAWPQDAQIEYSNPDYMRQFDSYGQAVTVSEDAKATVTIDKVLIPSKN